MASTINGQSLEDQIGLWREFLTQRQAVDHQDVEELESHLRDQVTGLVHSGLATDEAFLVAVKRMGDLDALSREFAREHSDRLWKQLVVGSAENDASAGGQVREWAVALALAIGAATAMKLPSLFGVSLDDEAFYIRNVSFFVLPLLTIYFVWKRTISVRTAVALALAFTVGAVVVNAYPFAEESHSLVLAGLHVPIALWFAVGVAYAGGRWREHAQRMHFVRFTGELFIYYVLIALGGGVLTAFTFMMFSAIGFDVEWLAEQWIIPCGAAGAVLIGAWLVEAKQSVIENMAPVLTRIFTPLFALVMLAFLGTMIWTGNVIDVQREVLIGFDLLLVVVLGLLVYSISARDARAAPGLFDVLLFVLIVSALAVDLVALGAIAARISEFGFTPNRVAALGENVILLIHLAGSAFLYGRFLRRRGSFDALERWQTAYLPVYPTWAVAVVVLFPPMFGFA